MALSAVHCNGLCLRCEAVHGRSDQQIAKRHTVCVCSFEIRFDGTVCLHYLAVFCSPTAFFEHSYTSEQLPFRQFEFHPKKADSRPDAAVD
jgi:hypothetical protein